jgi:hypothetical protein
VNLNEVFGWCMWNRYFEFETYLVHRAGTEVFYLQRITKIVSNNFKSRQYTVFSLKNAFIHPPNHPSIHPSIYIYIKLNVRITFSLCLSKYYATKTYVGMEVQIQVFLSLALHGSELSVSRPGRFTPGERVICTHWIGGWLDPRAGLDMVSKRKIL